VAAAAGPRGRRRATAEHALAGERLGVADAVVERDALEGRRRRSAAAAARGQPPQREHGGRVDRAGAADGAAEHGHARRRRGDARERAVRVLGQGRHRAARRGGDDAAARERPRGRGREGRERRARREDEDHRRAGIRGAAAEDAAAELDEPGALRGRVVDEAAVRVVEVAPPEERVE